MLLNEGVIILAALTGILCFNKFKNTSVKYFIYFLIYVVFVELLGYYPTFSLYYKPFNWIQSLTEGTLFEKNFLWYSIFWVVGSALFISFYFRLLYENQLYKKSVKYITILYVIFSIVYFIFNYEVYYNGELKAILFFGAFIILLCTVLYFLEILQSDKIMSFYKSFNFYVASVFLIWFLIKTPISFYQIYYSTSDWNFVFLRRHITLFTNLFMYLTFIFAFLCCKPKNI
ncbi:hypothetical protein OE09_1757 [Flavobacteriaceae bacterium MAR_2010_72]|nr:hypothetical protein OE09_1757 [Flavobacteriaceae bacterium MAR_2010_72]TVZ59524.1 hypothetical protein NA63_2059 [Flavobacteriaceae bacterium MAR_2010_105]